MHVKLTNGQPSQFPYSIRQLRRDNPQTSFPKVVPDEILHSYGVFPVRELDLPPYDRLVQTLVQDAMPHEVDGGWVIGYTVANKPQDEAEQAIRNKRDQLLAETDWMALSDVTMSTEMQSYRQALRDITGQAGFPYSVTWPTKP